MMLPPKNHLAGPHLLIAEEAKRFGLVGQSQAHLELLDKIVKIAGINVEILITGPTGIGKELYARYLHERSTRRAKAFVPINCANVQDHLFENELFGHQAGAFTGAQQPAEGLVAAAEGGTLFLDEVQNLSAAAQVKLLRLLQEKEYRRLGETRIRRVDVRFIAATNANLRAMVDKGTFREDLFHRLWVVPIHVPPLCERPDDIAVLLLAFVERYAALYGLPPLNLTDEAWVHLFAYHWPGNIRELENCVRNLTCQQFVRPITPADLPLLKATSEEKGDTDWPDLNQTFQDAKREVVARFEKEYLVLVLQRAKGNISAAARLAGMHRRAYFELLRKYHIDAKAIKAGPTGVS
jgi:two-component system, NtrC family, response regulator GlrR